MKKAIIMLLLIFAVIVSNGKMPRVWSNPETTVRFISEREVLGPNAIGTEFDVAVVVQNVENLYGLSVKIYINETYFQYVTHTTTIPWNDTQTPVPPSPYAGILYAPVQLVRDQYYPTTHILEIAYSSMAPAASFNGSGTVCVIRLNVTNIPISEEYVDILAAKFTEIKLAGKGLPPPPILYTSQDLTIRFDYTKPTITDIVQFPPPDNVQPSDDVMVNATVTDEASSIKTVILMYSTDNGNTWNNVSMSPIADSIYTATIPKQNYCTHVQYMIVAEDSAGNIQIEDNAGEYYVYHVVSEFGATPLIVLMPLTLAIIIAILKRKNFHK